MQNRDTHESALERPHVVIVTDDLGLSRFLTEGLLQEGFWTSAIGSGLQFIDVLRLRSFDALLIDAGLGDIAALEVIRRIRGLSDRVGPDSPRSGMPAIVIAGFPGEVERDEVQEAGGHGVLEPPFEIDEVGQAVRSVLSQADT